MEGFSPSASTTKAPTARILRDMVFTKGVRGFCSSMFRIVHRCLGLLSRIDRYPFIRLLFKDSMRFMLGNVQPISGETLERAKAAAGWLLRAQAATADDGVSYGYFPYGGGNGWRTSYPETTGYIISTLIEYTKNTGDKQFAEAALRMARWEVIVQMKSGAVQANALCAPEDQVAAAFNTGMVLDGWSAAFRFSQDDCFLKAGQRAGDFLVGDMNEHGYLQSHGKNMPVSIKTFTCLCAWPLCRLSEDTGDDRYRIAAVKIVEAALKQQHNNGWFANNCLTRHEAPLLHTIGYTLQGILEVGIFTKRDDFVGAAQRSIDSLISQMSSKGFLSGRFYSDWNPAAFSSCLTGSAQVAVVCYRLFEYTGDTKYRDAADSLLNYLKALQLINIPIAGVQGALSGSFPIVGVYQTLGYPNWATKYYLDALMCQQRLSSCWKYSDIGVDARIQDSNLASSEVPSP